VFLTILLKTTGAVLPTRQFTTKFMVYVAFFTRLFKTTSVVAHQTAQDNWCGVPHQTAQDNWCSVPHLTAQDNWRSVAHQTAHNKVLVHVVFFTRLFKTTSVVDHQTAKDNWGSVARCSPDCSRQLG
jgi:hypothetical protein